MFLTDHNKEVRSEIFPSYQLKRCLEDTQRNQLYKDIAA